MTTGNGIPVVEAVNGGTTALDAFMLAGRVVTGPYEYALYRGGLDVGSEADWFLRSTAPPVPEPVSEPRRQACPIRRHRASPCRRPARLRRSLCRRRPPFAATRADDT